MSSRALELEGSRAGTSAAIASNDEEGGGCEGSCNDNPGCWYAHRACSAASIAAPSERDPRGQQY